MCIFLFYVLFDMFGLVDNLGFVASNSVHKYYLPVCMHVSALEVERVLMQASVVQTVLGTVPL